MNDPGALEVARRGVAPLFARGAWAGALGVVAIAYLGGWLMLPRLRAWRACAATLLRLVAGLVPASLAVMLVGQRPGLLFHWPWRTLAAAGLVALLISVLWRWRRGRPQIEANQKVETDEQSLAGLVGWVVLAFLLLFLLIPAFAPPINYDVLEYHLGIVPHIFELGRVRPIPHVFYTAQPLATEMLYTLGAMLEGTPWGQAPGLLHWFMLVLGIAVGAQILRLMKIPAPWRPWLLLILLTHPIVFLPNLEPMSDWTGLLMLAGGIWVWLEARGRSNSLDRVKHAAEHEVSSPRQGATYCGHGRQPVESDAQKIEPPPGATYIFHFDPHFKCAVLLGIFAGGALGAKWTNFGTVVVPLLVLAFFCGFQEAPPNSASTTARRWRAGLLSAGLCGLIGFLFWLPWGLWLWFVHGNPVAPFLAGLFPTPEWPPARLHFLLATHGPLAPWQSEYWTSLAARMLWKLPGLPLIAFALLGALVVAALGRAERRKIGTTSTGIDQEDPARRLLFALVPGVLVSLLLWGQLRQSADRFLTPTLLAAVLMLAASLKWLMEWFARTRGRLSLKGPRLALTVLLAIPALWSVYQPARLMRETGFTQLMVNYDLGRLSRTAYWREMLGVTAELYGAANALPPGSKIIAVNEARRYPFARPIALASVFDESPLRPAVRGASDGETIRRRLAAAGATHLLVNEFEQERILHMHTPLSLIHNDRFQKLLAGGDRQTLIEQTVGATEFSVDPLNAREEAAYRDFLQMMRPRAIWSSAADPGAHPAMWIAPLGL